MEVRETFEILVLTNTNDIPGRKLFLLDPQLKLKTFSGVLFHLSDTLTAVELSSVSLVCTGLNLHTTLIN